MSLAHGWGGQHAVKGGARVGRPEIVLAERLGPSGLPFGVARTVQEASALGRHRTRQGLGVVILTSIRVAAKARRSRSRTA